MAKSNNGEHLGVLKDMSLKFGSFSLRDQDVEGLMTRKEQGYIGYISDKKK